MFAHLLIILTTLSVVFLLIIGLLNLYLAARDSKCCSELGPMPLVEVLVPIKGFYEGQELIFRSLLNQNYPNYLVNFILEKREDDAYSFLEKLCAEFTNSKILISGPTRNCGQKNHSLAYGASMLDPDTIVLVTCDGNSIASPEWLTSITRPIRKGQARAVTTFRTFNPQRPASIAGICQAIYGSLISMLIAIHPKPWGGSTAVDRSLFELLDVRSYWNKTVVDDLVLGNVLVQSGIKVHFSLESVMETPLPSQTINGFLGFLHRQILFPKFTNPAVWLSSMVWQFMLSASTFISILMIGADVVNLSFSLQTLIPGFFLLVTLLAFIVLNKINPHHLSLTTWILGIFPLLALSTYVYAHSIAVNHIDWSGKRYYCGKLGVVKRIEELS